jgi:hypothetical protein
MKTYTITSHHDGNDFFEVEAEDIESAALAALEQLGWSLCETKGDE